MAKNKERLDDLEQMLAGLRRDYDALVNTLTVRDSRIAILEQGREATNTFIQQHVAPSLGAVGYHDALLRACVAPKGIRAMGVIHKAVMAKAKRAQGKREREAKLAAPPEGTLTNDAASTTTDVTLSPAETIREHVRIATTRKKR